MTHEFTHRFPANFVWGAATAAFQIEGAVDVDGRTPSIWDTFCRVPGAVANGDTGEVACDSYRRWPEDLALLRDLGLDAYRFSVAWPRILPASSGEVNVKGLDHYERMVDDLLDAGIRPFVTLYHWDLPQYVQDAGGWPARDTALRLAEFAAVVAGRLGDRVTDWITVNEPLCVAWLGHLDGTMAPGMRNVSQAVLASYHVLLAHGLATESLRATASASPSVGLVTNLSPVMAASDDPADREAAHRGDGHVNRWWLDPVFGRGFPADMLETYGVELPVRGGDLETIAAPLDFLGVNYYFPALVAHDDDGGLLRTRNVPLAGAPVTAMGWPVDAAALEQILVRVARDYGPTVIYVTENGSAYDDHPDADGNVVDTERVAYLEKHLAAVGRARAKGAPVEGYFAWSLLDNFEWAYGYAKRFGLVRVDYDTQRRTVKASGRRYTELIAEQHSTRAPAAAG